MELKNGWELEAVFAHGEILKRQGNCRLRKGELHRFSGEIIVNAVSEGLFIDRRQKMIRFSLVTGKVFE